MSGIDQIIIQTVILGCKKKKIIGEKNEQIENENNEKEIINKNGERKNAQQKFISNSTRNSDISKEYIELVYYEDKNYSEINEKIKYLYRYYNNIGDIYTIMNKKLGQPEFIKYFKENNIKYEATLNLLVIGSSGVGKSTLINLLLNEKKARVGIELSGLSNTKLFSRYIHHKYPIVFIDTPGIENTYDFKKIRYYILKVKIFSGNGKNKIHAILYIINSSNVRYFNKDEINLIKFISQKMKIQIFFVCTRASNEMNAFDFKEFFKVNLKQIFGIQTPLTDFIYCCQLLDEKDGIYKKFGIDELLNGIHKFFLKEKNNLENIQKNILNNPNYKLMGKDNDYNQNLDESIILNSLKNGNFKKYLNTLCDDIITFYIDYILIIKIYMEIKV